jgi:hypothetical protein
MGQQQQQQKKLLKIAKEKLRKAKVELSHFLT